MSANPYLNHTEWLLLWTFELGKLDTDKVGAALARLEVLGLATHHGTDWRVSDEGRFLAASRRTL